MIESDSQPQCGLKTHVPAKMPQSWDTHACYDVHRANPDEDIN